MVWFLNVLWEFMCWRLGPQGSRVWRWGLWEVTGSWGLWTHDHGLIQWWIHGFVGFRGWTSLQSDLSLCFLAAMRWAALLCHVTLVMMLPHHRPVTMEPAIQELKSLKLWSKINSPAFEKSVPWHLKIYPLRPLKTDLIWNTFSGMYQGQCLFG